MLGNVQYRIIGVTASSAVSQLRCYYRPSETVVGVNDLYAVEPE